MAGRGRARSAGRRSRRAALVSDPALGYKLPMTPRELAPIVGIPACVVAPDGFAFHRVGAKYVDSVVDGAGGLPVLIPALGARLDLDAVLDGLDGLLLTGSPSQRRAASLRRRRRPRADSPCDPARDATTLPLIRAGDRARRAAARDLPRPAGAQRRARRHAASGGARAARAARPSLGQDACRCRGALRAGARGAADAGRRAAGAARRGRRGSWSTRCTGRRSTGWRRVWRSRRWRPTARSRRSACAARAGFVLARAVASGMAGARATRSRGACSRPSAPPAGRAPQARLQHERDGALAAGA